MYPDVFELLWEWPYIFNINKNTQQDYYFESTTAVEKLRSTTWCKPRSYLAVVVLRSNSSYCIVTT